MGTFGAPGTKSGAGGTYSGCASMRTSTVDGGAFALLTLGITGASRSLGVSPPGFKETSKEDAAFIMVLDRMVFGALCF